MSGDTTQRPQRRAPQPGQPGAKRILEGTPGGVARKGERLAARIAADKAVMLSNLTRSLGNISASCDKTGISRQTYYQWLEDDPEFAKEVAHIKERSVDFVEGCLFQQIKNGNATSTIFFLKTRARHRGYVEVRENVIPEGAGGEAGLGPMSLETIEQEVPGESLDEIFEVVAEGRRQHAKLMAARKREMEKEAAKVAPPPVPPAETSRRLPPMIVVKKKQA